MIKTMDHISLTILFNDLESKKTPYYEKMRAEVLQRLNEMTGNKEWNSR